MYQEYLHKYIPPGFDLAKYDSCINIGLIGWIENIASRIFIYLVTAKGINSLSEEQIKLFEEITEHHIELGILLGTPNRTLIEGLLEDDKVSLNAIVKEISYLELFILMDEIKTEELEELYSNINFPLFPLLQQDELVELNQTVEVNINDDSETVWLRVDMGCSKNEIMESFENWLNQKKAESDNNKAMSKHDKKINIFNETAFRNWHSAKVLPYIDLVVWNVLNGNKISDKFLNDILFPSPTDPASAIGTKTKPYVKKLMTISTFRRMLSVLAEQK